MKLINTHNHLYLARKINEVIKKYHEVIEYGTTLNLSDSSIFLDIEITGDIATVKWIENVDTSFHNDDYMYYGEEYKTIKKEKINLKY